MVKFDNPILMGVTVFHWIILQIDTVRLLLLFPSTISFSKFLIFNFILFKKILSQTYSKLLPDNLIKNLIWL